MDDNYLAGMPAREPQPAAPAVMPRLLAILAVLLGLLIAPTVVERIQFALVRGRERAQAEVARQALSDPEWTRVGQSFAEIAKAVGPSVVHIDTVMTVNGGANDEWAYLFGTPQYEAKGQGSGVIVDAEGYVVTNNHVIEGAAEITVSLSDGRTVPARVVGADPLTDLAVLKINATNLITAPWGNSDKLEAGSMVWAIGNPFGLDRSITFGIISAKSRRGVGNSVYQEFLQTDAAINPGNSGGPLVNAQGEVIGINTAIIGRAYQGVGFSIPSNTAREVYERLKATGKMARGWLGAALADLTPDIARKLDLKSTRGALIQEVIPGAPADKAGLQPGDVVVRWNDTPVEDRTALSLLVAKTPVGETAKVVVIRDNEEREVEVIVQERPDIRQPRRR